MSCEKRRIFKCRRIIDTSTTNEQFSDDQISNLSANFWNLSNTLARVVIAIWTPIPRTQNQRLGGTKSYKVPKQKVMKYQRLQS